MQLAVIKKMTYQGGGDVAKPAMTALSIGKRRLKRDMKISKQMVGFAKNLNFGLHNQ